MNEDDCVIKTTSVPGLCLLLLSFCRSKKGEKRKCNWLFAFLYLGKMNPFFVSKLQAEYFGIGRKKAGLDFLVTLLDSHLLLVWCWAYLCITIPVRLVV